MVEQNELLRRHALEKFGPLVQEISRDPAMLIYLDSATNRKQHPNENYAREIDGAVLSRRAGILRAGHPRARPVLHRLGDQAGQIPVQQVPARHGAKSILGETGDFGGRARRSKIVLKQRACPRVPRPQADAATSCSMSRFPPLPWLLPLAGELRAGDLEIGPLIAKILASNLFFSTHAIGRKVRSPVELGIGLLRAFRGTTNLEALGQRLARDRAGGVLSSERQGLGRRPDLDQLVDAPRPGEPRPPGPRQRQDPFRRGDARRPDEPDGPADSGGNRPRLDRPATGGRSSSSRSSGRSRAESMREKGAASSVSVTPCISSALFPSFSCLEFSSTRFVWSRTEARSCP